MELLTILAPTLGAVVLAIVGAWIGRKMATAQKSLVDAQAQLAHAQAEGQEGDTSEVLSKTAKLQIETYTELIVKPLKEKIAEISQDLIITKEELKLARAENSIMREDLFNIKLLFRQVENSLDYLVTKVKDSFPDEVNKALEIRKGKIQWNP